MHSNVGSVDRRLRFVLGPVLVALGAAILTGYVPLDWGVVATGYAGVLTFVGGTFVVTAWLQWCPLNALFGIDTAHGRPRERTGRAGERPA